jgi:molecular chaperone GrpE
MTVDEPPATDRTADLPEFATATVDGSASDGPATADGPANGPADGPADDGADGPAGDGAGGLAARLAALADELRELRLAIRGADERAAARERIIDRLHEDNQRLRAGDRQLVLRPVLTDLRRLRNDLLRQAEAAPSGVDVAALLRSYAHEVELALERGGVEVVRPAPGDRFDAARHRPQDVLPAAGPEADGTVAEVLADGYRETVTDLVLAPATVRVRRWTQRQEDASA